MTDPSKSFDQAKPSNSAHLYRSFEPIGGSNSPSTSFGTSTQNGTFGKPTSGLASSSGFGAQTNEAPALRSSSTSTIPNFCFGSTTDSKSFFGQPSSKSTGFNSPSTSFGNLFGTPRTEFGAGSVFGAQASGAPSFSASSTSAIPSFSFGSTTESKPLFGQYSTSIGSGKPSTSFGSSSQSGTLGKPTIGLGTTIGSGATGAPLFSASSASAKPTFSFGNTTTGNKSLFGQSSASVGSGSPSTSFGTSAQAGTLFGKPSTGFGSRLSMECPICFEQLDNGERLPKVLSCGHTVCLQCLRLLPDKNCPTCRQKFDSTPEGLPNNFTVLQLLEEVKTDWVPRGWCSDCRTAATVQCWDEHDAVPVRRALRRKLQGVLPQAAGQLEDLQDLCQGDQDQALQALTLLAGESWDVSVRGAGPAGHEMKWSVTNSEDPLVQAMWLVMVVKATKASQVKREATKANRASRSSGKVLQSRHRSVSNR